MLGRQSLMVVLIILLHGKKFKIHTLYNVSLYMYNIIYVKYIKWCLHLKWFTMYYTQFHHRINRVIK